MQHKNKQVNVELWKEAQKYGDVQLMPFVDYYSLITLKTIALSILGVCRLILHQEKFSFLAFRSE